MSIFEKVCAAIRNNNNSLNIAGSELRIPVIMIATFGQWTTAIASCDQHLWVYRVTIEDDKPVLLSEEPCGYRGYKLPVQSAVGEPTFLEMLRAVDDYNAVAVTRSQPLISNVHDLHDTSPYTRLPTGSTLLDLACYIAELENEERSMIADLIMVVHYAPRDPEPPSIERRRLALKNLENIVSSLRTKLEKE